MQEHTGPFLGPEIPNRFKIPFFPMENIFFQFLDKFLKFE